LKLKPSESVADQVRRAGSEDFAAGVSRDLGQQTWMPHSQARIHWLEGWDKANMIYHQDSQLTIHNGDALAVLQTMAAESVQCCVTSPPYYGLRDYGVDGQIGMEETPEAFIAKLVDVFREVRRVLKDDGTCWVNIGDSYWGGKGQSGSGGMEFQQMRVETGVSFSSPAAHVGGNGKTRPTDKKHESIKPKDLIGIPWMLAFALRADGWYLRSEIIWHKLNPMPESVTDRPTKGHEQIFLLSKSAKYFYDADAAKEPLAEASAERYGFKFGGSKSAALIEANKTGIGQRTRIMGNRELPKGRNRRSVWSIASAPYTDAHFATFPPALIEPCILAGSRIGDTVIDCFGGSGTTAQVANKFGRKAVLIELNPDYCELAMKRNCQKTLFV